METISEATSDSQLLCPHCQTCWTPAQYYDDSAFYLIQESPAITGALGGACVQGGVIASVRAMNPVITDFCSHACQCDWLKSHGSEQLQSFSVTEICRLGAGHSTCTHCGMDPFQRDGADNIIYAPNSNPHEWSRTPLIQDSETRYYFANGFYGSPVDGGAIFCNRNGIGCILEFFRACVQCQH